MYKHRPSSPHSLSARTRSTQVMTTSIASNPGHVIFAFSITALWMIVQMHFPDSSPLEKHPICIWIFLICSLFYCFAVGYYIKCQIYTPADDTHDIALDRSANVAFISGSFAYAALISVLVPRFFQPPVFIICIMVLFIYFNRKKLAEMGRGMASCLCDLWTRLERRASSLYEPWSRSERQCSRKQAATSLDLSQV